MEQRKPTKRQVKPRKSFPVGKTKGEQIMPSMDLFQYERKVRVYNIAKQICNVFSKFLGVKETVPQLKKHLKEEVEELLSAKNKKEMAFECADVIILCMRILIVSGQKDPLAIIDEKGKIVLNRLEKAVGIQMRTPGLDGREAYRLAKQELEYGKDN
jgi:predicted house-cleaning noncanonical NTP pyrophosphatase (MazG superfamily)